MAALSPPKWLGAIRIDRRARWLIAIAAVLASIELLLPAWDAHRKTEAELATVRKQVQLLAAADDGIDWVVQTRDSERQRAQLQSRLWQAPSQAQAEARLRDWLTNALSNAAVAKPSVSLLPVQSAAAASAAGTPALLRVRASVGFELAPKALENALVQIEAGGQLARVDTLSASVRTRRVEMTVSVPVQLRPEADR